MKAIFFIPKQTTNIFDKIKPEKIFCTLIEKMSPVIIALILKLFISVYIILDSN